MRGGALQNCHWFVNDTLADILMDTRPCSVCGGGDDDGTILLCDECNKPYHNGIHCAGFVTECDYGDWACLNCSEQQSDEDEEGASQDEEVASVAAGA